MISIPPEFAATIESREGTLGRIWLDELPNVVAELCQRWHLSVDGDPMHGHLAIVVPVRRQNESYALKVSWQDVDTIHEARALQLWNGRGTVQVLASSPQHGAMLIEWLDPHRTLFGLPLDDAIRMAGTMVRNLAVPGDSTLPTATGLAESITRSAPERWEHLGRPIAVQWIDQAVALGTEVSQVPATSMVNWDLHYGNVLFSPTYRRWVATDPKPAVGVPESGIAPLIWTRISDFSSSSHLHQVLDRLISVAELDAALTHKWLCLRVVDFWLWELSVGLNDDPGGCAIILDWLAHR
jgi:streptomycin 6-kinase